MKPPAWSFLSLLAIAVSPTLARADDLTTAFQLPAAPQSAVKPEEAGPSRLPIPPMAAEVPFQNSSPPARLPPPPPIASEAASIAAASPVAVESPTAAKEPPSYALELSFQLDLPPAAPTDPPSEVSLAAKPVSEPAAIAPSTTEELPLATLFDGGPESLVARVVGSAEGTRTPEGHRNPAYYGHRDPGNGVWNLGSFSYQHGAATPEEADQRQLQRLQQQTIALLERAQQIGVDLTLEEKLNGIDLANQAPQAALDRGGYIDWLAETRKLNLAGDEAILMARTRAFLDPDTQQWNAPGLGNTVHSISHDQERRMRAIARALTLYQPQNKNLPVAMTPPLLPAAAPENLGVDRLLALDLIR